MWEDVEKGVFRRIKNKNSYKIWKCNGSPSKKYKSIKKNIFLDFLTIETNQMPDNNYEMRIVFSGDSIIKIISEVIEVTLDDQGEPWETKNKPKHKVLWCLDFLMQIKKFNTSANLILSSRKLKQKTKSALVKNILFNVKKNGDRAVFNYEKKFSNVKISSKKIQFSQKEINKISKKLDPKIKKSIDLAFTRIKKFHLKQKFLSFKFKDKYNNELSYKYSAIDRVGVYVPGGTASYPSTVLMNCIPALVAGVKNIYLTTPTLGLPVNPAIIYAAKKCGVKEIYKTGGAHSIAAFTYGTKTFKKVDKIVGPGNAYVASAKKEVFGEVGIDMIAGPSEVSILADKYSNPDWMASDLIAQAEHDIYAQSILL